jgi:phage portal protein BeeE
MFGNADVKIIDKDGKEILTHPVLDLIRNPTPLHTMEEWLQWLWVMDGIYANSFIYTLSAFSNTQPRALWVLPTWDMKLIPTGKIFSQTKIEDIVKRYESISNPEEKYEPSQILHMKTGVGQNPLIGQSKIPTLQLHISNGNAALTSRNINLVEMGPKGIISGKTSDSDGAVPMGKKTKTRIEEQWTKSYGIKPDQRRVSVVETPVTWTPISFPSGEMMFFEEVEEDFGAICGEYNMPRDLFPSIKGATYENAKQAEKGCYQSTIQPRADSLAGKLTKRFAAFLPPGAKIIFDYSWLPVMQEDQTKNATTLKAKTDAVVAMVTANIINPLQGQALISTMTDLRIDPALASTDPVVNALTELSPLVANNMLGTLTINEVRSILKLGPVPGGDQLARVNNVNAPSGSPPPPPNP